MDGPRDYHIKWKKSDNYHTISYMESKKNDWNEIIYRAEIDSQT